MQGIDLVKLYGILKQRITVGRVEVLIGDGNIDDFSRQVSSRIAKTFVRLAVPRSSESPRCRFTNLSLLTPISVPLSSYEPLRLSTSR